MSAVKIRLVRAVNPRPVWKVLLSWVLMIAALFGPGVYVESVPMQWAGFIMLLLFMAGVLPLVFEGFKDMTIAEARKKLDQIERAAE